MDFSFSAEQKLLQSTLRNFAERELSPAYATRDKDEDLPRSLVRQLASMGLLAPMVDPRFGGQGLDYLSLGIAHEEIARADFNAAYVLLLSALVGAIVAARGDDAQRAAILPPICRGEAIAALAVTSRARSTRHTRSSKPAVRATLTSSMARKAPFRLRPRPDTALVMARTGSPDQGARGISAFYVDLDSPGVTRTRFKDLGSRAIGAASSFSIRSAFRRARESATRARASSR